MACSSVEHARNEASATKFGFVTLSALLKACHAQSLKSLISLSRVAYTSPESAGKVKSIQ
jgi:hypothetical protein